MSQIVTVISDLRSMGHTKRSFQALSKPKQSSPNAYCGIEHPHIVDERTYNPPDKQTCNLKFWKLTNKNLPNKNQFLGSICTFCRVRFGRCFSVQGNSCNLGRSAALSWRENKKRANLVTSPLSTHENLTAEFAPPEYSHILGPKSLGFTKVDLASLKISSQILQSPNFGSQLALVISWRKQNIPKIPGQKHSRVWNGQGFPNRFAHGPHFANVLQVTIYHIQQPARWAPSRLL